MPNLGQCIEMEESVKVLEKCQNMKWENTGIANVNQVRKEA